MKIKILILAPILLIFFSIGCNPEEPTIPADPKLDADVLIANEGNFGTGKGTLSTYNSSTKEVFGGVYESINNQPMGNVFQGIERINNNYYFTINNSSKVIVANDSFRKIGEISGFSSPRYIYEVSASKAYVSDLLANKLSIVDLGSNTITGSIAIPGWTEKGAVIGAEFWVCGAGSGKVYIINPNTDMLEDSIVVGPSAAEMVVDQDGYVWVMSSGDFNTNTPPKLVKIDPSTKMVIYTENFSGGYPTRLTYHSNTNRVMFLNGALYARSTDTSMTSSVFIDNGSNNFYGFGINESGEVYLSDALDFVQRSQVLRFDPSGVKVDEFTAGVITGSFWFK